METNIKDLVPLQMKSLTHMHAHCCRNL